MRQKLLRRLFVVRSGCVESRKTCSVLAISGCHQRRDFRLLS